MKEIGRETEKEKKEWGGKNRIWAIREEGKHWPGDVKWKIEMWNEITTTKTWTRRNVFEKPKKMWEREKEKEKDSKRD